MTRSSVWTNGRSSLSRRTVLQVEQLESRLVLTATGNAWPHPQLITLSFVRDGTIVGQNSGGYIYSNLFSVFNAKFGTTAKWENEILKAAQMWAQQTNINFSVIADSGGTIGSGSYQQGDPNMGDIRISGYNFGTSTLAYAGMPPPVNNYSVAGDIQFNTGQAFNINTTYDVQSVAMHEIGHALGLDHSSSTSAVMYATYLGTKRSLGTDDITVIKSVYNGARAQDAYDTAASNGTFATASNIQSTINTSTLTSVVTGLDITTTSDVDDYTFTAPSGSNSSMTVTVQSQGLSLLTPALTVYASDQTTVLGSASGAGQYGTTLTVTVSGITPGQQFYVKVAGADTTQFSTGAYALTLNLGTGAAPTVPLPNTQTTNGSPPSSGGGEAEVPSLAKLPDGQGDAFDLNEAAAARPVASTPAATPAQGEIAGPILPMDFRAVATLMARTPAVAATVPGNVQTSSPNALALPNTPAVTILTSAAMPLATSSFGGAISGSDGADAVDTLPEALPNGSLPDSAIIPLDATVPVFSVKPSEGISSPAAGFAARTESGRSAQDVCFAEERWDLAVADRSANVAAVENGTSPAVAIAGLAAVLGACQVARTRKADERSRCQPVYVR